MNYESLITPFFDDRSTRTIAIQSHRALLAWQANEDDRELRREFIKTFAKLPVEF